MTARPGQISETTIALLGRGFVADPSGALWCPASRLVVVSDLHLEKGSSLAARRMLLPPYDTARTLAMLAAVIARYRPRTVISLGDSFHDRAGPCRMAEADVVTLRALQAGREWVWVAGNHDPSLDGALPGLCCDEVTEGGIRFAHEPTPTPQGGEIAGHLHPCVKVTGRGGSVRRKAFVSCETRIVMPAFGAFTGGLDIRSPAIRSLFPDRMAVFALGQQRAYQVAA
ncbi:MAG: ligase-associated DNA damage response endonuclease PdeM [Phreatobacter sp.]|uniref:ligase-associated DNA damage response endonuclease PdeM n=1 Tax=Phreatobacter sp. TaxID=1966341 RepID=UPI002732E13A|nr:ligase-associated DNA damage response endonuclease PdeM [Phreatobacter sp.]MDP2801412.1 ligase-associated DNA damage response endonuclease PdeM [Phreatobacter sp.]